MSGLPVSSFVLEYAVRERVLNEPNQWRTLMRTTEFTTANAAFFGLRSNPPRARERWSNSGLSTEAGGPERYQLVARLVGSCWLPTEEVADFLVTLTQALNEWDATRSFGRELRDAKARVDFDPSKGQEAVDEMLRRGNTDPRK